jgi:hypothetical protein
VSNPLPWILIGNPENRRVKDFERALAQQGQVCARVFSHLELLGEPDRLLQAMPENALVRIDSWGENDDVTRALWGLGQAGARARGVECVQVSGLKDRPEHGEVLAPTQLHLGALAHLENLNRRFAKRPGWKIQQDPAGIVLAFDKRNTHDLFIQTDLPAAPVLLPVKNADALDEAMEARGLKAVFVKHRYSSSASCLAFYDRKNGVVRTSLEVRGDRRFNSLKMRHETGQRARDILDFILSEGAHVEAALKKAKWEGAYFDLRILVIGGEPVFTVMRQNRHPVTNLHLGGWRGDVDAFFEKLSDETRQNMDDICRQVAVLVGLHHIGVDLMLKPDLESPTLLEINAFGDLLPGLSRDGLDAYGWEIRDFATGAPTSA